MARRVRPPHPGEVLQRRFLDPRGIRQQHLADHIGEDVGNLNKLLHGERRINPGLAWRLALALGTTPRFWTDLQADFDLWEARPRRRIGKLPTRSHNIARRPH
jgi:addiction module HigA family antidote